MSRLEKLIQELCPNGVEFSTIDKISTNMDNERKPITSGNREFGEYPYYGASGIVDYVDNYIFDGNYLLVSEDGANLVARNTPIAFSVSGKTWINNHAHILKFTSMVTQKFVEYYLNSITLSPYITGGAQPKLNQKNLNKIPIPFPPLPIQEEIVRILDTITELSVELTRELAVRKKQYEYYRDFLLKFDKNGKSIRWLKLGDVTYSLNTGLNPRQFFRLNTDDAENYYVTIREIQGNRVVFNEKTDRINDEALRLCNNRSNLEKGDILFSGTGTIGETAYVDETPTNWNIKEGVYSIKPIPEKISSKYLMYILQTTEIKQSYMKKVAGGTVKSIPMKDMKELEIPVPSLDVQNRIVKILNSFNTICTDLNTGLPAEIEARKKQYEYYRDKLLSFKESNK